MGAANVEGEEEKLERVCFAENKPNDGGGSGDCAGRGWHAVAGARGKVFAWKNILGIGFYANCRGIYLTAVAFNELKESFPLIFKLQYEH
jgi:hypothetical protein